ncbi:MAG: intradiol ring-cleavage dioxygenase [Candidatus Binataceae bacterium]
MRKLSEENLTSVVLERFETSNPRLQQITSSLIRHLHDFARETGLTAEEWRIGIDFLTAAGHITDDKRQEFILLSDTLGLSALVDLIANRGRRADTTETSLLGPFYREGAPELPAGATIADGTPGEPLIMRGKVDSSGGGPIKDAMLDVWQASPQGLYDLQDPNQPEMNLRGRFRTDKNGCFEFRSVKPSSYPVPHDGPVGKMLRAQGRHPYRPAHIHFIVSAAQYRPLVTALYMAGDRYIESDAVFGARESLVVNYRSNAGSKTGASGDGGADAIEFNFTLAPM